MKTRNILFVLLFSFLSGSLFSQDLTGIKIYIDPGHGGWSSEDRGIATPLYPSVGPNVGFWESQSNLDKGLQLRTMLEKSGAKTQMSRTTTSGTVAGQTAGLALSTIVRQANEFQADFMLSIHSNAGAGTANYVLQLYSGQDIGDTYKYPTPVSKEMSDKGRDITTEMAKNQYDNKLTYWTSTYRVTGDKTFGRTAMGWSDGYGVLRGLTVPGTISEGAMHDYIPETYRLLNMEYKWMEAWNFYKTFCTYFKGAEIPTGNIAGWVKDSRNLIQETGSLAGYKKYGKDVLQPLNGAKVTVLETGEIYTVDNQRNGVYVFKDLTPGVYNVKAEADGYFSQTQVITVVKNKMAYFNFELNKIRNTPPEVIKYSPNVAPGEAVECSTDIVLEFNWDMDEESVRNAFSITPEAEGVITFEDSQYRMRFRPNFPLETGTLYTVKLDKSAKHPANISMVEDFILQFTTKDRNRLVLLEGYPADGDKGVYCKDPVFYYIFDRKLYTPNLRDEIKVLEGTKEITKATRSVINNNAPTPYGSFYFQLGSALEPNKSYKVVIGAEVKDEIGMKVVDPVVINFTTSPVAITDKTIIEDFATAGKYACDAEESASVTGVTVTRSTSTFLFSPASCQLKGTFAGNDAYVTYRAIDPTAVVNNQQVIGLHVYGDLSQNELQLQFTSGTEVRYVPIANLNFAGWEFVETELSSLPPDTDYTFSGIRVVRKEGILSGTLNICLDNMLLYDERLTSLPEITAGQIEIYPNPASETIFVKTPSNEIPVLQLYSFNGILLKEARANEITVNEFGTGTYILKVKTETGIFGKPIIINK